MTEIISATHALIANTASLDARAAESSPMNSITADLMQAAAEKQLANGGDLIRAALNVIVKDAAIQDWLKMNHPTAFIQAMQAIRLTIEPTPVHVKIAALLYRGVEASIEGAVDDELVKFNDQRYENAKNQLKDDAGDWWESIAAYVDDRIEEVAEDGASRGGCDLADALNECVDHAIEAALESVGDASDNQSDIAEAVTTSLAGRIASPEFQEGIEALVIKELESRLE